MNKQQLESYIGKKLVIYCCRYIYSGEVVTIDDFSIELTNGGIVYETGAHDKKEWETFEKIVKNHHITLQSIEAFGEFK